MELDVRPIPRARKHATIFDAFAKLEIGEHFTLVNDHDPVPLRDQFEVNFARSFSWDYDQAGPEIWRVRIGRTATTALPQVLADLEELATTDTEADVTGAIWKIPLNDRDLDTNVISLPAGQRIEAHHGPDVDVMVIVIAGRGTLLTKSDELPLETGAVVWLPKRSRRSFAAGEEGLRYLTVHVRKGGLRITSL